MRLASKTAIITGAAGGIGAAAARLFAREGARVALVDLDEDALNLVADDINSAGGAAIRFRVDVARREQVERTVAGTLQEFGRLDILFNNAAVSNFHPTAETDDAEFNRIFDINLRSVFHFARAVVPRMKEQGNGSIINTSSITGIVGAPGMAAYSASKGAIITLTRTLALEVAEANIRVNCLCPASVDTPMLRSSFARAADPEDARRQNTKRHPLGRLGTPEDVAYFALFLASDESSWITGGTHVIDGGASIARRWKE